MIAFLLTISLVFAGPHCWYSGFQKTNGISIKQNFIWSTIPQCSNRFSCNQAFASTGYGTNGGGNVNGYFGMQQTSQGMKVIFSLWDYSSSIKSAQGLNSGCSRFGGEGEGAHCMASYNFQTGVTYEMEVYVSAHDSSGGTVTGVVVNKNSGQRTIIGSIKSASVNGQILSQVSPTYSFLEYFAGGTFYSAVGFKGPFIDYYYGPTSAVSDCDGNPPSSVDSCIPGQQCGAPNAYYQMGAQVQKKCGNMWPGQKLVRFCDFYATALQKQPIRRFSPIYKAMGELVWAPAKTANVTVFEGWEQQCQSSVSCKSGWDCINFGCDMCEFGECNYCLPNMPCWERRLRGESL